MLKRRTTEQDEIMGGAHLSPARKAAVRRRRRRNPVVLYGRVLGVLLSACLACYLGLLLVVNAGRLKPRLEAALGSTLGRAVHIGDLKFGMTFGSLIATDVRVADDASFGPVPILQAQRIRFGIRRLGLLSRGDLRITSVDIEGASITLVRDARGSWNFSSILAAGKAAPAVLAGPRVRLKDGVLNVRADADMPFVLREIDAEFPHFSTADLPFNLTGKVAGGGTVKLNGKVGPLSVGGGGPLLPLHVLVNAKNIALAKSNLAASIAPAMDGLMSFDGSLESDGKVVQVSGNLIGADVKLSRLGSPSREPLGMLVSLRHDLASKSGSLTRGEAQLSKGSAGIAGTYTQLQGRTVFHLEISGHAAPVTQLAEFLPSISLPLAGGASLQGGVASFELLLEGSLDHPTIEGSLQLDNTRLNGFNFEDRLSTVSGLDLLHFSRDLEISHWTSKIASGPEKLAVEALEVSMPEMGVVSGKGAIGGDGSLDFHMIAVRTGDSDKRPIPFTVRGVCSAPIFR